MPNIKVGSKYYRVYSDSSVSEWVVRSIMNRPRTNWHRKLADPVKTVYLIQKNECTWTIIERRKDPKTHKFKVGWAKSIDPIFRISIPLENFTKLAKFESLAPSKAGAFLIAIRTQTTMIKMHEAKKAKSSDPEYYDYIPNMKRQLSKLKKNYQKYKTVRK